MTRTSPREPDATRVLVASRRRTTQERLKAAMEAAACVVTATCGDAATVLAAAAKTRPDVCVIHLDLRGGGLAACRALAARRRPPRIIILAPADRQNELAAAMRAGADGFVLDDLDPARVPDAVAEVAAGRPYLSSGLIAQLIAEVREPLRPRRRSPDDKQASH